MQSKTIYMVQVHERDGVRTKWGRLIGARDENDARAKADALVAKVRSVAVIRFELNSINGTLRSKHLIQRWGRLPPDAVCEVEGPASLAERDDHEDALSNVLEDLVGPRTRKSRAAHR